MPAYNAEKTLKQTIEAITPGVVDEIILVDDASQDNTVEVARELGLHVVDERKRVESPVMTDRFIYKAR